MAIHACCQSLFQMFHLFLRRMLQAFIWMLHMFHAYIVSVLSGCCMCLRRLSSVLRCFASVLNVCCECFRHMLQVFQLFSDVCYKWFYLAVANRLSVPCICNRTHLSLPPAAAARAPCMRFPCEAGMGSSRRRHRYSPRAYGKRS
jgi:hypothetical protein